MTATLSSDISRSSAVVKGVGQSSLAIGVASYIEKLASIAASKFFHNLLDRLPLLSPRTWYGVLQSQTQSAFHDFDGRILAASFAAAIFPLLFLAHFFHQHGTIRQREFLWRAVTPVSLLSPWNIAAVSNFTRQCRILATAMSNYWYGRVEALPTAVFAREDYMRQGRLTEHRRYDVFWPPKTVQTGQPVASDQPLVQPPEIHQAILFLPGYGISHLAYSEVACRLSDAGLAVVVPSMEPLRIAHRHLGADLSSMRRIMKRVQGRKRYKWHLMGHSAGAFGAMFLYDEFHRTLINDNDAKDNILLGKLVLWGCAAVVEMSTNLSHLEAGVRDHDDTSILLVQGTDDYIVNLMKGNQEAFDRQFPSRLTSTHWIQGGSHHGFASYQPTWPKSPENESAIPYSDQQDQACDKTLQFLLHSEEIDPLARESHHTSLSG